LQADCSVSCLTGKAEQDGGLFAVTHSHDGPEFGAWPDTSPVPSAGVNRLTGTSPAVRLLEKEIQQAGNCDAKVLITGESGVGKEVVARLIHDTSPRRQAPMLAINCAGIPDSLLESELFGHERGSFTGAYQDRQGLCAAANHGTLFLDEVCEMTPRMQALLLRFLESGETQRVGCDKPNGRTNVRIIAATNKDVCKCVAAGEFREDLFFRLNVLHIVVPPLRERREDLPALIDHFLSLYSAQRGIDVPALAPCARERLAAHHWPGNVRELRNAIESAMMRVENGSATTAGQTAGAPQAPSVARTLYDRMAVGGESFWPVVYDPFMARDITRQDVREIIRLGLQQTFGSYRILISAFHMRPDEYKRFLNFLRTFNCHVPFHSFRAAPARAGLGGGDDQPREGGSAGADQSISA
jgi:DNA-binding NtrC family response regulator